MTIRNPILRGFNPDPSIVRVSDDYYINMTLNTEMELPHSRETVLHYFELIQKQYPEMRNFYCRERGDFVLEEDKEGGCYRWCTLEPRRICSGQVNPENVEDAMPLRLLQTIINRASSQSAPPESTRF